MPFFVHRPPKFEFVQVSFATWNEVCAFMPEVGPGPNDPHGVFVDKDGKETPAGADVEMGLKIPEHLLAIPHPAPSFVIARQGEWLGKTGKLYTIWTDAKLHEMFAPA